MGRTKQQTIAILSEMSINQEYIVHLVTYQLDLNQPQNTDILHSIVEVYKEIITIYMTSVDKSQLFDQDILWKILPISKIGNTELCTCFT